MWYVTPYRLVNTNDPIKLDTVSAIAIKANILPISQESTNLLTNDLQLEKDKCLHKFNKTLRVNVQFWPMVINTDQKLLMKIFYLWTIQKLLHVGIPNRV